MKDINRLDVRGKLFVATVEIENGKVTDAPSFLSYFIGEKVGEVQEMIKGNGWEYEEITL